METKFTAKDILEKDFKTGMRGYNQDEVDHFLDEIIQDYEIFSKKIEQLQNENKRLRMELEDMPRKQATPVPGTTNFDILRRLSHLENHVFGNKLHND
ncbi:DivIVA domain-containing protein [Planomicrobium soli]|uniref:Cell cycle protein GpsB n=1 Tax=Planomicrobium soli TaxID=1176648 RepID=A0A2P8H6W6_9BACL|nr:cell division regulator GpsB [Planomicrobium soli]PSL41940.1 DivIVA domain-containing protein [Planomicrobium soli]